MNFDEVEDQAAAVADDGDAITSMPSQAEAGPNEPKRHRWRAAGTTAGVLVLGAGGRRRHTRLGILAIGATATTGHRTAANDITG